MAAAILGSVGAALLLAAGGLVSTRAGADWAVRAFAPPTFSVEEVRGRLRGPLVLHGVRLQIPSGEAKISEVQIEWQPLDLLRGELRLTRIGAREVELVRIPSTPQPEGDPTEVPALALPIAVILDELRLEELVIRSPVEEDEIRVSQATLRAELVDRIFRVDTLAVTAVRFRGGRIELGGRGSFSGRAPHPVSLSARWSGALPDDRPVEGEGQLEGDLSRLSLGHRISRPVPLRIEAVVRDVLDAPEWEARAELFSTALRSLMPEGPDGSVRAVVSGRGSTESATARFDGSADVPDLDRVDLGGRIAADGGRIRIDSVRASLVRSGGSLRGRGLIDMGGEEPSGSVTAEWSDLRWPPMGGEGVIRSPSGTLALGGSRARFEGRLDAVAAGASLPASRLRLDARGSGTDGLRLSGDLMADVEDGERLAAAFEVTADSGVYEIRRLRASVAGTEARAELEGRIEPDSLLRVDLAGRWSELRYPLRADSAWASPRGRFRLTGSAEEFTLGVEGAVSRPGVPLVDWSADVEGGGRGDTLRASARFGGSAEGWPAVEGSARMIRSATESRVDTLTIRIPETGARLDGSAFLPTPSSAGSRARARATWRNLGWPLSASPVVRSDRGTAMVEAVDSLFRVRAQADVSGARVPDGDVSLDASGTGRLVVLDSLLVETLGGRITGDGRATRDSLFRWTLRLEGRDLDPTAYAPEWPGSLDLELETRGTAGGDGPRARIAVSSLEGSLRERSFRAALVATLDPEMFVLDTLRVASGASRLDAAGSIGSRWDLAWNVEADDAADFHPAAQGRLRSRGRVAGPSDSLRIEAAATGEGLSVGRTSMERLDVMADLDLGGASPSTVRADVRRLTVGATEADSIRIRAAGRPNDHRVDLHGFWGPDHLAASLSGGATGTAWRGGLERLDLASERAGRWALAGPAPLRAGTDSASLEELCWVGPAGRACAGGSWSRADGVAWNASSRGIPLTFFAPFLPPSVEMEGTMALDSRGTARPGEAPTGEATLQVDPGVLRYRLGDGTELERSIERFHLEAAAGGGAVEASADVRLAELGSVEGSLRAALTGPTRERSVEGRLGFRVDDGGLLGAVGAGLADTGGRVSGAVEVEGTLGRPGLRGRIDVEDGRGTIIPLGTRITGARLALRPDEAADGWRFEGGARSGEGSLEVSGHLLIVPDSLPWSLESRVSGNRFEVYRTALGHVLATPDVRIRASPERIDVTGDIALPRARLTARRLEPTVATSADVVVTGGSTPPGDEPGIMVPPIFSGRVSLALGGDVGLDALGIRGDLEGTLLISADPGRSPTASGELRILRGSYTAYRQTLQIERGRLLYANSPLDDPSLDLRITRRARNVLAGMNVTGSARGPTVTLFSEPTLADHEILAYLITGRPLGGLSQGEGRLVESLSRSVGISGGNLVLARIGMMFGLEHSRLEAGPGGEGASVVLGKQLLPRLEVDYAVGLLGAPNVARLRYRLGRGWYLQSESGRETGADLVYLLEER